MRSFSSRTKRAHKHCGAQTHTHHEGLQRHFREKVRPARGIQWHFREKARPTRLKTAFFGHFGLAGRTFSRSQPLKAEQGELFRARSHSRPSRANFFAHGILPRSDFETNNTNARPQQGSLETGITSARGNRTKNADFSPAKATTVSDPRATSPTAPRHGAHGWRRHHRPQISHVIYRGHFLRHHKNVAIPAMRIQDLKQSQGNYVRNL